MDPKKTEEFKHNWKAPQELNRSRPREVRITHSGAVVRGLGFFLAVGAPLICLFATTKLISIDSERNQLASNGLEVRGEVVRLWKTSGENKRSRVAYRFEFDGRSFEGKTNAPLREWSSMQVGSPITIRLLPANPRINHPAAWQEERFPLWIAVLLGLLLAAVGGLIQMRVGRQRGLLEQGRPAPGVITKYSGNKDGRVSHYEFLTLNGTVVKGRCKAARNLPPVGGDVCVVYDADNPRRNSTYPMMFWKLANLPSNQIIQNSDNPLRHKVAK